ncbi:MAG: hypothetical protein FWG92_06855 [Leptospirales bacterium]|nr:hypothetical protein [Leptospirales bacterium]
MRIKTLFFTAVIMSTAAAVFAQDTKITPYASIRYFMGAYYQSKDFRDYGVTPGTERGNDKLDFANSLLNTSRLGARFQKGDVSGEVQVRTNPGHSGAVTTALAYGRYKAPFGLEITAGQMEAPWSYANANEAWDNSGDGIGSSKYQRNPQVMISFKGFYVDFLRTPKAAATGANGYHDSMHINRSVHMPFTAVGYEFKSDRADVGIGAAGYKYTVKEVGTGENGGANIKGTDQDAWTYIGYLHGQIKLGAPYIKFNATYQKSPHLLGMPSMVHFNSATSGTARRPGLGSGVANATDAYFEGFVELGFKTGLGTLSANVAYIVNLDEADEGRMGIGLNFAMPIVSGFKVTPAVLYIDEMKDRNGDKQGFDLLAGVKLQYDL